MATPGATCVSTAPCHRRLRVQRYQDVKPCGSSLGSRLLTPLSDCCVAAFTRSIVNLEAGFKERVLYIDDVGTLPPPCQSDLGSAEAYLARVAAVIGTCNPISMRAYAMSKKDSRRRIYERACSNLEQLPLTLGRMSSLAFFVKREATLHSKRQVPRVISPRTPEFNVLLGRYLKPVEERIYDALRVVHGSSLPVVAKGLTQQRKAEIIVEKLAMYGCCVGLDASRFDQSISQPLLRLEHGLYRRLYPGARSLAALLRCQLTVNGVGRCPDGALRYKGPAMRCSGDVNTSLGNCIISVTLAHVFLSQHGITGDIFCDGDDCLLFVPPSALPLLQGLSAWYLGYGLRMKVEEPAYEPERVEFCQSRPVFDGQGWVLCRGPAKAFNTDGFVPYSLGEREALVHLRAVGLCGLSMAAGMPLFDAFYDGMVRDGITGRFDTALLKGLAMQHSIQVRAGHHPRSTPVLPECRMSFWRAFGISPDEQLIMERLLRACDWRRGSMVSNRRQHEQFTDPRELFYRYYPDRTHQTADGWCSHV